MNYNGNGPYHMGPDNINDDDDVYHDDDDVYDDDDGMYDVEVFEKGGAKEFLHEIITMIIKEQNKTKKDTTVPSVMVMEFEGTNEFFDEEEIKYASEDEDRSSTILSMAELVINRLSKELIPRLNGVEKTVDYSARYAALFKKYLPKLKANRKIENEVLEFTGYNKPFLLGITKLYSVVFAVVLNSVDNIVVVGIGF